MSVIKDTLYERAISAIKDVVSGIAEEFNAHHKQIGKMGIVDRVRAGKVQLRQKKSDAKGYKVVNGQIVKMTPEEARTRRITAKISARKRRGKEAVIQRKRTISIHVRTNRLG